MSVCEWVQGEIIEDEMKSRPNFLGAKNNMKTEILPTSTHTDRVRACTNDSICAKN